MDPYVKFTYGQDKKKSTVIERGGLHPIWTNEIHVFSFSFDSLLKVQVYDRDRKYKQDDFIGYGEIEITTEGELVVEIMFRGKSAGKVYLRIVWIYEFEQ